MKLYRYWQLYAQKLITARNNKKRWIKFLQIHSFATIYVGYMHNQNQKIPEAGFLVSTESGNRFLFTGSGYLFRIGDLETVTTFHKTRRKRDPSPLFKTGRKRDKLEKPGRKRGKRPKIPESRYREENTKKPGSKPVLVPGFSTKNSASGKYIFKGTLAWDFLFWFFALIKHIQAK
jgi:hypothetical protein